MQDTLRAISQMSETELKSVMEAVKARRKTLSVITASVVLSEVKVGDRVKLTGLSPKYLNDCHAKVESIGGDEIGITLEDGWFETRARQRFGNRTIRVKPQCVRVVDAAS